MTRIAQLFVCTLCASFLFACSSEAPKQPATPAAPTKAEPAKPATPATPAMPAEAAAKPTDPAKPAEAKAPEEPAKPSKGGDLLPDPDFQLKSGEGFQLGGKKKGGLLGGPASDSGEKKGPSLLDDTLK